MNQKMSENIQNYKIKLQMLQENYCIMIPSYNDISDIDEIKSLYEIYKRKIKDDEEKRLRKNLVNSTLICAQIIMDKYSDKCKYCKVRGCGPCGLCIQCTDRRFQYKDCPFKPICSELNKNIYCVRCFWDLNKKKCDKCGFVSLLSDCYCSKN